MKSSMVQWPPGGRQVGAGGSVLVEVEEVLVEVDEVLVDMVVGFYKSQVSAQ